MSETLSPPQRMTLAEMSEKYPRHWVLFTEPDADDEGMESGSLVFASEDRDETWEAAKNVRGKHIAVRCTIPPDPISS